VSTVNDALQEVLDETRQRFVATFPAQCDSLRILVDAVAAFGPKGPVATLTQATHRLTGLAGTIGFPTVSVRAGELERLLDGVAAGVFDAPLARAAVDAIRQALTTDLAVEAGSSTPARPPWTALPIATARGAMILLAEDEPDQRMIVTTCLAAAGYTPVTVVSGDLVVEAARAGRPAVILLDIAMPRLDGYSVCRLLKADPELAGIPVIFMTAGANLDDRLAGLTLGADEFLSKPVDMRELVLRIELLIERTRSRPFPVAGRAGVSSALSYDAFLAAASTAIAGSPAALIMIRLPTECHEEGVRLLIGDLRGRDLVGACGPTRVVILMPEVTAAVARDRIAPMVDRLIGHGLRGACAGVTAVPGPGFDTTTVAALIAQADEAVTAARYLGETTAIWSERPHREVAAAAARTVVVAEDDPDVIRIVDAQLRASGHQAFIAFDGEQALAAIREHAPDVVVLDLMMPKLNGFDVLTRIREMPVPRPRVIVLSGRGREQDVMRAFELGADDYVTKPFNPQELMARIARLLK
jgi:two-component system cell cycle response regulator